MFKLVMKFHDRQSSERCIRKLISRHCLDKTRTKWNGFMFLITDDRDFRPQKLVSYYFKSWIALNKQSLIDVEITLYKTVCPHKNIETFVRNLSWKHKFAKYKIIQFFFKYFIYYSILKQIIAKNPVYNFTKIKTMFQVTNN